MNASAISSFTVDTWEPTPLDDVDGVAFSRVRLNKTFRGDLEGSSTVEMLAVATPVKTSQAYVGLERIVGRLKDRSGSFVLQHSGIMALVGSSASWAIVPDSGTGDLLGLRGTAQIVIAPDGGHTLNLEYSFESVAVEATP